MSQQSPERQASNTKKPSAGSPPARPVYASASPREVLQRAQIDPASLTPADVLQLQRSIGNRATGRLLAQRLSVQTKLQLGPADDKYEQEADAVARQVVRRMSAPPVQRNEKLDEATQALPRYDISAYTTTPSSQPATVNRTFFVAPKVQRDPSDDLRSALRKRRGMATGQSEEDVNKEYALNDFLSNIGKRATEEAQQMTGTITPEGRMATANAMGIKQEGGPGGGMGAIVGHKRRLAEQEEAETVQGDPYVDRIKLGELVSTRGVLGAQGFGTLLEQQRQREKSRKWSDVPTGSPLLGEHRSVRDALDQSVIDFGEAKRMKAEAISHAAEQHKMLNTMYEEAFGIAKSAAKMASWDKTQLGNLALAAKNVLAAVTTPEPDKIDDVGPRVTLAQNAIGALNVRAKQDVEWMESLAPYDEATIKDGLIKMDQGDKSVMNNSMSQDWSSIVSRGSEEARDNGTVALRFISLLKEIDRKTPFDAEVAKGRMTGPQKKKDAVMLELIARTSAKRSIMEIVKAEPSAVVLEKFVKKFSSLDNFDYILSKTSNRTDLEEIAEKANPYLPALRRVYRALSDDPARVKFLLVGDGGQKINGLDDWLQRGGKVWEGGTCTEPTYDPATKTKEEIEAVAVPKEGSTRPPNGGYAGNRVYGAKTKPPDMFLPQFTTDGTHISYREYDTKRFYPGVNRGAERFVKGSDGRYYYTSDHYHTFEKFA